MEKQLLDNVNNLKVITNKNYGKNLKQKTKNNMNGALIGGFVGVIIGIASKKNFYITGLIGIVLGRLLISKILINDTK